MLDILLKSNHESASKRGKIAVSVSILHNSGLKRPSWSNNAFSENFLHSNLDFISLNLRHFTMYPSILQATLNAQNKTFL